jgi:hypothetical protein
MHTVVSVHIGATALLILLAAGNGTPLAVGSPASEARSGGAGWVTDESRSFDVEPARDSGRDTVPHAALRGVRPGDRVRLLLHGDRRLEGTVRSLEGARLLLEVGGSGDAVPLTAIESVWKRGHAAGTGALVGGAIGLVAGAVYGALLGDFACSETPDNNCALGAGALLGLVGGAGGAGVGALVGLAIPVWHRRWP